MPPAQAAYGSCGTVLGANAAAQSSIDNTAKINITPRHGSIFYIDTRRGINASYVAYSIKNTDTSTKKNLWVKLSNFTAASGNSFVSLANAADNMQQIPSLASNASYTVYFLVVANKSTTVDQSHTVEVFAGDPRLVATGVASSGCDYTFNRIDQTIAANANKVTSVSVSTTTPVLGGTVVITVNGSTGTAGAGDAAGDKDVMWVSPASVATWPTRALRLESTQIQIKRQGKVVTDTFNDSLIIMQINKSGSNFTSKTLYTSTYTFRVIGGASANPTVKPVAQIASGTQMKHTGSYGTLPVINLTSLSTPITVTKSAAAAAYSPTSCDAASKFAVRYTITARLASGTAGNAILDEIVDIPPAGSTFDTRINQATYSDASPVTNAALGTPSTITGETPSKLHWTGPFYVTSTTPATFSYTMCVNKTAGTYQNTAYAYVGNTIVGSNSLQVSCQIVTSDGTTFTLSSTCNTAKPKQPQSITFSALDSVGVSSITQLYATSSSGLAVVFSTSSSSSICTVAFNATTGFYEVTAVSAGTCVINANQSGDSTYDAATQVPQNLTIKAGQYITVSTTTSMLISRTQDFTATSFKRSDNTTTGLAVTMTSLTPDLCTVAVVTAAPNFRVTSLTKTGLCSLMATQAGDATYGPAVDVYVDINIGSLQVINFTNPGNQTSTTSPSSPITISATSVDSTTSSNTNLQVVFSSLTPDVCDISTSGSSYVSPIISSGVSSTTLVKSTAGVCTLVASQDGTTNGAGGTQSAYSPATDVQVSFTIGQIQTITFTKPSDVRLSVGTRSISASTTSSLLLTFTSTTTEICTVAAGSLSGATTTATVTLVAGGTCVITASQAGNGSWYEATSVTQTFIVTGATVQTITFTQSNVNIDTSPIEITASASSGLPVTFAVTTSSVCSVSEIFVTLSTVGECTIVASQSGDVTYAAATNVTVTFVVFAKPTITFSQSDVVVASFPQTLSLSALDRYQAAAGATVTGLTVTFTSSTTSVCDIISGANLSLKAVGTCTIVASQGASSPNFLAADSVTVNFQITSGQSITFGALTSKTYGDPTFQLIATATSGLTVSFALTTGVGICSITGETVTILAAGSCSFTASQAGNASYTAATPVVQSLTIGKKALTFTATATNKNYDSTDTAALTLSVLSGVINSDAVSIDATQVTGRFNTPDVGTTKPVSVTLGAAVLTGAKAGNYSVTLANSPTANIAAKAITMTVVVANKNYDGTVSASITSSSLNDVEAGDNVTIDGTKVSGVFADPDKANTKAVTVTLETGVLTGSDASNYTVTVAGTPTANITARPITVVADNKTKGSGSADPVLTYSITSGSLVNVTGRVGAITGNLERANSGTPVGGVTPTGNEPGDYAISIGTLAIQDGTTGSASNYSLTFTSGLLTITNKIVPVICWGPLAAIPYGTSLSGTELSAVAKSSCPGGTSIAGTYSYTPATGVLSPGVNILSVTFTPTDAATYASASSTASLTVDPKPITVTAEIKSKNYGSTDPVLTFTTAAGALVGADALNGLLVRAIGENAGEYAINQGTVTTANNAKYVITFTGANLTIDRKLITLTPDATSKIYGLADPTLTYTITTGSLVPGDTLTGSLSRASGSAVGSYAISQNTVTNANNPNYNITFGPRNFSITQKPITMNVTVANREYDGQLPATISATSLNDVESGDTVTIDNTKVSGEFGNPDVGVGKSVTVTLAANVLTGTHASNYTVSVAGSPLANITTRAITITAVSKTKSATAADPTFTYTVTSGSIVNRLLVAQGETGSLTRANLGVNTPGTYAITIGSLAISSNYLITYIAGTLTISDKTVPEICWSSPSSITYGTELSATQLNATAREVCGAGSDLPGSFAYTPNLGAILIPGTHTLSVTFTPTNTAVYASASGTVSITVTPKNLTLAADAQTKFYGDTDPTFTYTFTVGALVGADTLSGTFSRATGTTVGTYAITQGSLTSVNNSKYTIAFTTANLVINAKPITITADNKNGTPSSTPTFTVSTGVGALVGSDAISGATFSFSGSGYGPTATAPTSVGTFTITPSSATFSSGSTANYLITYATGSYLVSSSSPPPPAPPSTPQPVKSEEKPAPVKVVKKLPVKKVTLTSSGTGSSPVLLDMITSATGTSDNRSSLASIPEDLVRKAVTSSNVVSIQSEPTRPKTTEVFENKPAYVENLSEKITVSLSNEESKIQMKDEKAIVQLNSETGEIRVQPVNGWTGVLKVPTYMATDEAIVEIQNVITINPEPAPKVLFTPASITRTSLGWSKSPTESVQKYEVSINGKLVCETVSTTCSVNKLIGPKTKVAVTAIGNEGTRSEVETGKYSPNKKVKVFTINFDEEKWDFTPTAIKKLNTYIEIIKREGFTQAFVQGYTDSQGRESTSLPLSKKRATVTTKYLSDRLPEVLFKWFALGQSNPLRKGLDPEDFAANRRAEIYVK